MRRLLWASVMVIALLGGHAGHAACNPDRISTFGYPYQYIRPDASQVGTSSSVIGHFWSPGAYATTGEQQCDDRYWLEPATITSPPDWFIDKKLTEMPCTTGCPGSELIVTVEDISTDGRSFFAAARIDKTPNDPQYDLYRLHRDIVMVPIQKPRLISSSSGEVFTASFIINDPANGFYGLPGMSASNTITAFWIYSGTGGRERANRNFVKRVPYLGGPTQFTATLTCPASNAVLVAVALEFDNGQVLTNYVSSDEFVECDPFALGAGAVRDGGPNGLFVTRGTSGDITLSWGPSCSISDNRYNVYEGVLGDFTSHTSRACGVTTRTLTVNPGSYDTYYLVVPAEFTTGGNYEGSYGLGVGGAERTQAAAACNHRLVNLCPP